MPTGSQIALFTDKKIMGFVDFETRFLRYLQNKSHEAVKRLFVEGSFAERMPISAPLTDTVTLDLKLVLGDGYAHDGAGHIFDMSQIDRNAVFENVNATTYEVGARYVEKPEGIRINPRTGRPEYSHLVEDVGREATPDSVTNNGSNLTIRVDSLFEQGVSVGNHAGRTVRVFLLNPNSTTEAGAIEEATVYFGGGQNQIDTAGLLGQTTVSTTPSDYVVQLVGLTVFKATATNRPSQDTEAFFAGTVVGSGPGNPPGATDNSAQTIIEAKAASDVTIGTLGNWADGTTNPATVVQTAMEKIVIDLTSTTGQGGVGKIYSPALGAWADSTQNSAGTLRNQLLGIVSALTSSSGSARGAGKLTAGALSGLPFNVNAQRLDQTLQSIMDHLNSVFTRVNTFTRGMIVNPPASDEALIASSVGPATFGEAFFLVVEIPSDTGRTARLYTDGVNGGFVLTQNAYYDPASNQWNADTPSAVSGNEAIAITIGANNRGLLLQFKSDTSVSWASWDTASSDSLLGGPQIPGEYRYSASKLRTQTIVLAEGLSDGGWTFDFSNHRWEATVNLAKIRFPLHVPSSCAISGFRVWVEAGDVIGNANFIALLGQRTYDFGVPSVGAPVGMGTASYGSGSGSKVISDLTIIGNPIDQSNTEYYLDVTASANAGYVSDFIHGIQLDVVDVGPRNF